MLLLAACGLASPSFAGDASLPRTEQLKAAYLFNFVKFVEWPVSAADDSIEICFVGAAGVQRSLQTSVNDKRIGARRVVVRTLNSGDAAGQCAVIYFESDASRDNQPLLQTVRTTALTVSDAQNFTRSGGVIQLFTEENRLRFVVNIDNARRAGLRISSNLLKLASSVEQEAAP